MVGLAQYVVTGVQHKTNYRWIEGKFIHYVETANRIGDGEDFGLVGIRLMR